MKGLFDQVVFSLCLNESELQCVCVCMWERERERSVIYIFFFLQRMRGVGFVGGEQKQKQLNFCHFLKYSSYWIPKQKNSPIIFTASYLRKWTNKFLAVPYPQPQQVSERYHNVNTEQQTKTDQNVHIFLKYLSAYCSIISSRPEWGRWEGKWRKYGVAGSGFVG